MAVYAILFLCAAFAGAAAQYLLVFHSLVHLVRARGTKRLSVVAAVMFLVIFSVCVALVILAMLIDQENLADYVLATMLGYMLGNVCGFIPRIKRLRFYARPILTHSRPDIYV